MCRKVGAGSVMSLCNSKGKRLSALKTSVFILTTKSKCLEVIQAASLGTLENSMFIVTVLVLIRDSFICELVAYMWWMLLLTGLPAYSQVLD